MKKHGLKNFKPEDYTIVASLCNEPPTVPTWDLFGFAEAHSYWKEQWKQFGGLKYNCEHCGKRLKYCIIAEHESGEFVVMGGDCAERIGFISKAELERFLTERARLAKQFDSKITAKAMKYVTENGLQDTVNRLQNDEDQKDNDFALDVLKKLFQYGSLSEAQLDCLKNSCDKHAEIKKSRKERAEKRESAPDWKAGVQTVKGKIVSLKFVENEYGTQAKCVVVLEDGRSCYGTCGTRFPWLDNDAYRESGEVIDKKAWITFTADFTVSDKDSKFAFYKRPKQIKISKEIEHEIG